MYDAFIKLVVTSCGHPSGNVAVEVAPVNGQIDVFEFQLDV